MHRTERDAGALGGLQQAPGLAERLRQRLLNKRMQARIDRDRDERCMSPQGRADMHGIQAATPQRFMDFGKGLRSTHAPGKRLGFRDIGVDDATTLVRRMGMPAPHQAGADDRDTDRWSERMSPHISHRYG